LRDPAVSLVGLPAKVTTTEQTITKDKKDCIQLTVDKASPAGSTTACSARYRRSRATVHNVGGTQAIDPPPPPKPNEPAKPVVQAPPLMPMPNPPPKREPAEMLRLEQEDGEGVEVKHPTTEEVSPHPFRVHVHARRSLTSACRIHPEVSLCFARPLPPPSRPAAVTALGPSPAALLSTLQVFPPDVHQHGRASRPSSGHLRRW
jgi:hypothetical protein